MDARIVNGELVVTMQMIKPRTSASGKTKVVATSRGAWESNLKIEGKPLLVMANAYIRTDKPAAEIDKENAAEGMTRKKKHRREED